MTYGNYLDNIESNLRLIRVHDSVEGRIKDIAEHFNITTSGKLMSAILLELIEYFGQDEESKLLSVQLDRLYQASLKREAEKYGVPIEIDDSVGDDLIDYKIFGNSIQEGVPTPTAPVEVESVGIPSVNLCKAYDYLQGTNDYLETTFENKNCVRFRDDKTVNHIPFTFKTNTQYTVSLDAKCVLRGETTNTAQNTLFTFFYTDGTRSNIQVPVAERNMWVHKTLTSTIGKTVASIGVYVTNYVCYNYIDVDAFMLEEGSTATEYQPYYEGYKIPVTVSGNPNLPDEYQEVEYIELNERQYIDSGVVANINLRVDGKISVDTLPQSGSYYTVFGACNTSSRTVQVIINAPDGTLYSRFGTWYNNNTNIFGNTPDTWEFSIDKNKIIVNGVVKETLPTQNAFSSDINLYIGARNGADIVNTLHGKIYYMKIYHDGELVRDFIPCYKKSNNLIGLYDTVNGVFYINKGTGTFLKGKDVPYVTTTITLNEPLRKIGDYADYIDFENQKVVRQVMYKDLTSATSYYDWVNKHSVRFGQNLIEVKSRVNGFSNRNSIFIIKETEPTSMWLGINDKTVFWIGILDYLNIYSADKTNAQMLDEFNAWLTTNPTYICYGLDTPIEEPITLPTIGTFEDYNKITVDTTPAPSNIYIEYWSRG